jgi:chemotaxis protein methyltransferase CheR
MKYIKVEINSLHTKEKIKLLIQSLKDNLYYEFIFRHIKFLPYDLILKLNSIKKNIRIIVDDKKLNYYLLNLGFHSRHLEHLHITPHNILDNIQYIAIGGSAGSLAKIIDFIKFLPKTNLIFFIIMHHKDEYDSKLSKILKKYTLHYDIIDINDNLKIKPSTIYIAPRSKHIIVKNNIIYTDDSEPVHFSKPSISVAFNSFAINFKEKLLAIILCGYGEDGNDSLKNIKKYNGMVIIEQPSECQATQMIHSAIITKQYDKILGINDIAELFYNKYYKIYSIENNLEQFLTDIKIKYKYDYKGYNKKHLVRRIEHYYNMLEAKSFSSFRYKILNNKELFQDLFLNISINITTFFRNPDIYSSIKNEIIKLFHSNSRVKIWCAGCSSGEEPYSIAILLKELGLLDKSIIYATDINKVILEHAKNGLYSKKNYTEFKTNYQEIFDNDNFDNHFDFYDDFISIKEEIKDKILFFKHNLVENQKIDDFQLIICRNVIIYFNKDLTIKVFELFNRSLEVNGILWLGESETFYNNYNYKTISKIDKIFYKQE